jgi:PAS domain S-box-containing protein
VRAALKQATAERDELRRELDHARAALGDATRDRETVGAVASETEREREALRTELERAARRCEELSAELDAKTAELQALPGKDTLDAAKRDRDEARSALAAALAERDRSASALQAAAGERDGADAALRQAEAERDEARTALAEMASESEAARVALAEHEARAEELRRQLEEAERAAAQRAVEAEAAAREASEQRERVEAGFLATEALAHERAKVSELEAQIAALTGELEGALARAAEHAPAVPTRRYAPPRPFQAGLDDVGSPRAHIGLDGRFVALNEGFCELVGYSEDEFGHAYWPPVVDAEHRDELRRATARVIAGEVPSWHVDTVYMAGSGALVRVVGSLRLERDESGSATHLVLDAEPLSAIAA